MRSGASADPNNWRFLRNAFPAVTISDFTGVNSLAFAPAGSLTGLNATGPYANVPIGITPIPLNGGTQPGSIPLPDGVGTTTVPLDFRRGYINSFNFTIQQEIAGFVAEAGYVGTRGIRPLTNMNINPAPAGGGQNGRILNTEFGHTSTNLCGTTPCRGWSDINQLVPYGNNYYDALQTRLTRRMGSSQVGVVYTYSRAIDNEDNEEINFLLWPYPAYLFKNRAVAGFDRTHNFQAYGVYELPFGRGKRWLTSGIANVLAGGWQVNGVLSAMSGTPFTVTDSSTGASNLNAPGNTQTVDVVGPIHVTNGKPLQNPSQCTAANLSCHYFDPAAFAKVATPATLGDAGRNILRGPGYFNLDMSLFRNFRITERVAFQLEVNAFSVTNTPHFNNPVNNGANADIGRSNFGLVTSTLVTTNAGLGGSGGQRQWWFGGKVVF